MLFITQIVLLHSFGYLTNLCRIYPPAENDLCVAVGTDKQQVIQSIFLQPILENCGKCYRCFVEATGSKCPVGNSVILNYNFLHLVVHLQQKYTLQSNFISNFAPRTMKLSRIGAEWCSVAARQDGIPQLCFTKMIYAIPKACGT